MTTAMKPTNAQIEAAAKAMHEYEEEKLGAMPWSEIPGDLQEYWRNHARRALTAAAREQS